MRVVIFCLCSFLCFYAKAQTINVFVSPIGASTGNGASITAPVSLTQAKAVVKSYPNNPCIVWLLDGIYTTRLVLDATDSRSANAPVTYKSYNPDKAVFQILGTINRTSFQAIPDSIKSRIVDNTAKNNVVQLNLTSLNLFNMTVWPDVFETGTRTWPIFYKDTLMLPMAQYPNDSLVMTMDSVLDNGFSNSIPGGTFKYKDQRTDKWVKAMKDAGLWLKGNWRVPWQMTFLRVAAIDTLRDTIQFAKGPNNGIGDKYTRPYGNSKEPYVAINLLEEIDKEGEWAINFKTKMLYMWPPASGNINYSSDPTAYPISLTNVNYTNFESIAVRSGSGGAVSLNNCNYVRVAGMDVAYCYDDAITITGGTNCTITSNDLHDLGQGGVIINPLSANQFYIDQNNLTPNNHKVINNHIYNFAQQIPIYSAAVNLNGVIGSYVANNKIHGTPHVGILYDGNNNVIDYNEFYDIIKVYNDMGAIYSNGYNSYKGFGNKIHYNYVHDSPQSKGSMFDNTKGGDSSSYNIDANNYWANQNSNGTFNVYTNSIVINDNPAALAVLKTDTAVSNPANNSRKNLDSLSAIWARSSAFQAAYPQLIDFIGSPMNKAYTSRIWPRFTCNVLISNTAAFSGISDANLFNANGTTNSTYAQINAPWTNYLSVFANNTKLTGVLTNKISPFLIDSLKKTTAFSKTCNTDWHINRIGLYIDSFRTSIASSDIISGIAPTMSLKAQKTSFTTSDTVKLTFTVKNPNIANCISSVKFYDGSNEITGLNTVTATSTFDSIVYATNVVGLGLGTHNITAKVFDAPNWVYTSAITTAFIANSATVYRNKANSDISVLTNWGVNADGSGTNPSSFSNSNQYFRISNTGAFLANDFSISGTNTLFRIDTGYTLTISPAGNLSVAANSVIDFQGQSVVLQSSNLGTGSIGAISGSLLNATNVTIQRYFSARRAFRFIGHPFNQNIPLAQLTNNIDITGGNGNTLLGFTSTGTNNPSAFWYNTALGDGKSVDAGWTYFNDLTASLGNNAWNRHEGINVLIRGSKGQGLTAQSYTPATSLVAMNGNVNIGTQTVTLDNSGTGWNFIANPFPSSINLQNVLSRSGISNGIYVWNATAATRGIYQAVPATSPYILPSATAFMVKSTSAGQSLIFNENDKTTAASVSLNGTNTQIGIQIDLMFDSLIYDRLFLLNNSNASISKDRFDLEKILNSGINLCALSADSSQLSINSLPFTSIKNIPLVVSTNVSGNFVFNFKNVVLPSGINYYLHDKLTKEFKSIIDGSDYSFNALTNDSTTFFNRFEITVAPQSFVSPPISVSSLQVNIHNEPNGWLVSFQQPTNQNAVINLIDITGKKIKTINIGNQQIGTISLNNKALASGIYCIQFQNDNDVISKKVVK